MISAPEALFLVLPLPAEALFPLAPPPVLGAFLPELRSPSRLSRRPLFAAAAFFAAAALLLPPWALSAAFRCSRFAAAAFQPAAPLGGGLLSGRFCAAAFSGFSAAAFSCRLLSRFLLGFFSASCCASQPPLPLSAPRPQLSPLQLPPVSSPRQRPLQRLRLLLRVSSRLGRRLFCRFSASAFAFASAAALAAASCASLPVRPLWLLPPRRRQPLLQPASAAPSLLRRFLRLQPLLFELFQPFLFRLFSRNSSACCACFHAVQRRDALACCCC